MPRFSETPHAKYPITLSGPLVDDVGIIVDGYLGGKFNVEAYSRLLGVYMDHLVYSRNVYNESAPPEPWWRELDANQPIRIQIRGDLSKVRSEHTFEERLEIHTKVAKEMLAKIEKFLARNRMIFPGIDVTQFDAATAFGSAEIVVTVAQAKLLADEPQFSDITAVEILGLPVENPPTR